MLLQRSRRHNALRTRLAGFRQMTSLIDRDIIAASDDIIFMHENWVKMLLDTGHSVSFSRGQVTAQRAVDLIGRPMWYVRHADKLLGYHSLENDPLAATEEAHRAWDLRREVRGRWEVVEDLASRLLSRKVKFDVTLDDARRSALCTVGIEGFLYQRGLTGVKKIPGWFAAVLMKTIEPQVGFVIDETARRLGETESRSCPRELALTG